MQQIDDESLRSFISIKEEHPLNFESLLSLLDSEEGVSTIDLSLIQLLKTKFTSIEQNQAVEQAWREDYKRSHSIAATNHIQKEEESLNDDDLVPVIYDSSPQHDYRWEKDDLKEKSVKVDNFISEEEEEDLFSAYIPSFISSSIEKRSVVLEESLQVDDLEEEEHDPYSSLPTQQFPPLGNRKVIEEIETLEFHEEEEEVERTEFEEDKNNDEPSSVLNFMMFLAKSQPDSRNQQILYEYLSQRPHNTIDSFQPERLFTAVEEFTVEEEEQEIASPLFS